MSLNHTGQKTSAALLSLGSAVQTPICDATLGAKTNQPSVTSLIGVEPEVKHFT